jgi:hypothetical protein
MTDQLPNRLSANGSASAVQGRALFRKQFVSAARRRLPGKVCVVTRPTTVATLLLVLIPLGLQAVVVYAVAMPQRTRAVGVLIPTGGLL